MQRLTFDYFRFRFLICNWLYHFLNLEQDFLDGNTRFTFQNKTCQIQTSKNHSSTIGIFNWHFLPLNTREFFSGVNPRKFLEELFAKYAVDFSTWPFEGKTIILFRDNQRKCIFQLSSLVTTCEDVDICIKKDLNPEARIDRLNFNLKKILNRRLYLILLEVIDRAK